MDFARFSFSHASARSDYQKLEDAQGENHLIYLEQIDSLEHLNFLPSQFHRLLQLSYPFTDPFVAMSIVPSHYDDIPDSLFQSIQLFLAAAGVLYSNIGALKQSISTHESFVSYLTRNENVDRDQFDLQNFSFVSEILNPDNEDYTILDEIESPYILLFYTPIGFAYYAPPTLNLNQPNAEYSIAIIISRDQLIHVNYPDINYQYYQLCEESIVAQKPMPRIFCDFKLINGIWTPELHFDRIAAIMSDINSHSSARLDCRTINFNLLAGTSYRVIGLIGRYSDIYNFFEDGRDPYFKQYLQTIQNNLNPLMFFLSSNSAAAYVILYLPSDFMPNHPQYKEVVEYAYSFMRRACTLTLFVPVLKASSPSYVYSDVQGLLSQANSEELFFFGCGASQIICLSTRIAVQSMIFNDIYEFIKWLDWISPSYTFDFDGLVQDSSNGQSLNKDTILLLLENSRIAKNSKRNLIDENLYGIFQHLNNEQIADKLMSIRQDQKDISILINEAVNLTREANFKFKDKYHCKVCCNSEYKKLTPERLAELRANHQLHELCPACRLEKLRAQPRRNQTEEAACQKLIDNEAHSKKIFYQQLKQFISDNKNADADPQSDPFAYVVNKFVTWFFEFWCRYCLNAHWNTLKEGNYLHLEHFDNVKLNENEMIDESIPIQDVISILTEEQLGSIDEDPKLLNHIFDICRICANQLNATILNQEFRSYLLHIADNIIDEIRVIHNDQQMDNNYTKFKGKCEEKLEQLRNQYNESLNQPNKKIIKFGKIHANGQMTINVTILNPSTDLKFRDYSFNYVNSQKEEKFSARPLQSEKVAVLMQQTCELNIINSWRVTDGVLSLITIGNKMRLIFLPLNFKGTFVDRYIYEIEIGDPKYCYAEFATRTNTICIVTKIPNGQNSERYFILLKVSLDFTSSTEIRRRPLKSLLPLPMIPKQNDDEEEEEPQIDINKFEVIFNGFAINDTCSAGIIGATMPATSSKNIAKHYFVHFDPSTLSIVKIDQFSYNNQLLQFPITPIFVYKKEKPRQRGHRQKPIIENDGEFNTIVGISHINKNNYKIVVFYPIFKEKKDQPNVFTIPTHGIKVYDYKLQGVGDQIKNKIGISYFHNQEMIMISNSNSQPSLLKQIKEIPSFTLMSDMFNANFDFQSIPYFVAGCNRKYGFSEIEKTFFPTHSVYPVELIKFDIVDTNKDENMIFQAESLMMTEIKKEMTNIFPFEFSMPFRIYRKAETDETTKELNLKSLFLTQSNYDYVINFLARIVSLPQTFVHSIPRPPIDASDFFISSIETEAFRFMSKFPPLPLLRCTKNRECITISLVDIGSGSDGSSILSHVTGIPFVKSAPGTVNAGVNYLPVFKDNEPVFEQILDRKTAKGSNVPLPKKSLTVNSRAVRTFLNVIACQFRPDKPESLQANAIALYCAFGCSDLVIINAGTKTQFLVDALKFFIDVVSPLNTYYGQLLGNDNDENDDEDHLKRLYGKRIAFVTSLGSNPKAKIDRIQKTLTDTMAITNMGKFNYIFSASNAFIPSEWSSYQIAKSIADQLLLGIYRKENEMEYKNSINAHYAFNKSAAYFGSLLQHIEFIMESGTDEDDAAQVVEISDEEEN